MQNNQELPWDRGVRHGGLMDKSAMYGNLMLFKAVMDAHDIPFVFIFGAVLGLTRDKDLIDWDTDVDVFCDAEHHRKMFLVVEDLRAKGFDVPDKNKCPLHDHFFIRNGEKIEIWWFDRLGEEYVYDNSIRYPKRFFEKVEKVSFIGTDWLVPYNKEEFLTITYGDDWRIPNKNGSYILGRR